MHELLNDILSWADRGDRAVLAMLVDVEHSTPLPPGAAMAVSEAGAVSGSVSGGCVEGALVEEARALLESGGYKTVTYGISNDEAFAVGLTCGGTVHLFLVVLQEEHVERLRTLSDALAADVPASLSIAVRGAATGDLMIIGGEVRTGSLGDAGLDYAVGEDALGMVELGDSELRSYGPHGERRPDDVSVFIRSFSPAPRMLVFGAIDFAAAVSRIGKFLGYQVTVCDAREAFATKARFPEADHVVVQWPHEFLAETQVDKRTVICVLTHDPKFDVPLLDQALKTPAAYIGAMGSRRTHAERTEKLLERGIDASALTRISGPIGLDIGATTPEEVAVSIAAEIIALRHGLEGGRLSERSGPIHLEPEGNPA